MHILIDLYLTFTKIGAMMFGGGYAMLPILQREIVENKKWATADQLADYYAVGTNDAVKSQSIDMADEMLSRSDIFTPDHYVFYQKDGGYHDFDAVREYLYNALPVFFEDIEYNSSEADAGRSSSGTEIKDYYSKGTAIADVADDPAFGDYGRLIFPVNSGYMSGSTLGDLRLTWYIYIDPGKTVEICNYMKTHAENGDVIFYDIYTEAEKKADPAKKDTGLFFFNGDPGEKFAVCNAGGGFAYVGAMHDSFPHALELSKKDPGGRRPAKTFREPSLLSLSIRMSWKLIPMVTLCGVDQLAEEWQTGLEHTVRNTLVRKYIRILLLSSLIIPAFQK